MLQDTTPSQFLPFPQIKGIRNTRDALPTLSSPLPAAGNPWIFLLTTFPGVLQSQEGTQGIFSQDTNPTGSTFPSLGMGPGNLGSRSPHSQIFPSGHQTAGRSLDPAFPVLFNAGALQTRSSKALPDVWNPKFTNPTQGWGILSCLFSLPMRNSHKTAEKFHLKTIFTELHRGAP